LLFDAAMAGLDAGLDRPTVLSGVFVIAPIALSAVERPVAVAFVAVCSLALALLSGVWNDYFLSEDHLFRLGVVLAGGVVAVLAARGRSAAVEAHDEAQTVSVELRSAERRLEAILRSLGEAVTVRRADGRTIYTNPAARELLGLSSQEEIDQRPAGAVASNYQMEDEQGHALTLDDLPAGKVLRGEAAAPLLVRSLRRESGEERWILVKSTPLHDERGRVEAAINVLEDVTAVKRAELRTRFLAEASDVLASSLDYQQTLRNVAGLAVPSIADWCAVDLIDEAGERVSVAVAHVDPARLELARRLREYEPQELDPEQGLGLVVRTGQPALYPEISDEMLVAGATDEEHLALLRAVGFRSAVVVPMKILDRTIGALTMVTAESGRVLDKNDVEFAGQIAARAAVAVENSRLYTERVEVARTLQESLLPADLPNLPDWEAAALYLPAGQGAEVGGDFYDLWPVRDGWLLMVGDVTGKGVQAAALTSLVRHTARTASEFESRPAQVLARVDKTLRQAPALSLCTALCAHLAGARLVLACGGHPLPLRLRQGQVDELGAYGPLLGAFPAPSWSETECALEPGDTLVAFTDGVTDTVGEDGERFGLDRLKQTLADAGLQSPGELVALLRATLLDFQVGAQADDTAVLVLRYSAVVAPMGAGGVAAGLPSR
jgi:PAS domain S-box-containing protein